MNTRIPQELPDSSLVAEKMLGAVAANGGELPAPGVAEHTPTPWGVVKGDEGQLGRSRRSVHVRGGQDKPIAEMWLNGDDPSANAEFIIRACNSHDELVAELEEIVETLTDHYDGAPDGRCLWMGPLIRDAEDVLKKARGEA